MLNARVFNVFLMPLSVCRGALLTPKEMETLAEGWRPYRSLGELR